MICVISMSFMAIMYTLMLGILIELLLCIHLNVKGTWLYLIMQKMHIFALKFDERNMNFTHSVYT